MTQQTNRQFILARRPQGLPDDSTFELIESPIPQPAAGEAVVRSHHLSVDPYMRWRMNDAKSYVEPFALGEPLTGGAVGEVIASASPDLAVGDLVTGRLDWADFTVRPAAELRKLEGFDVPSTAHLSVLGTPGLTAYFGLLDIGQPKAGETVVVSGAAGAVGMIVGQLAKMRGCRVIGIAGSAEKNAHLRSIGFDGTIDYKTEDVAQSLAELAPDGVDVYFDNVGGDITDAVVLAMNFYSRLVLCGQIATYNSPELQTGPRLFPYMLQRSVMLKGFIVTDYAERFPQAREELAGWIREGALSWEENIVEGLENAPAAFRGLFSGENLGKQLVRV